MSYADSIQQLHDAAMLPAPQRNFAFAEMRERPDPKIAPKSFVGVRAASMVPCPKCSGWIKVYTDEPEGQCKCGAVIHEVP